MGFFLTEEQIARAEKAAPAMEKIERRRRIEADMKDPNRRGCDNCSLRHNWPTLTTARMPLSGNLKNPDILIVGEAPGEVEDQKGEAFVGPSGNLLRKNVPPRHERRCAFQNAVRCRPTDNATPMPQDVHACSVHLEEDLAKHKFKAILGVGNVPTRRFCPEENIGHVHGTWMPVEVAGQAYWFYPVFHTSYVLRTQKDYSDGAVLPVFEADMRKFFRQLDNRPPPRIYQFDPKQVHLAFTEEDARGLIDKLAAPIGVDLETNGLEPYRHDAKLLTAALSDGKTTVAFPIQHPDAANDWGLPLLLETLHRLHWIAHNAAFELLWLRFFAGNDPLVDFQVFDDTQALARIYHQRSTVTSLASQTRIHLGVNVKQIMEINAKFITEYKLPDVLTYNGLDAWSCVPLYHKLIRLVDRDNYERLLGAINATVSMELGGLDVDQAMAAELREEWLGKQQQAALAARNIYEVREYERRKQKEFNLGSAQQVGEALAEIGKLPLPKTAKGKQYSTDDEIIGKYTETSPLAAKVLEYREAGKIISTYIDVVQSAPQTYVDARIHPGYTVTLTETLRLSSVNPNIQNWPKRRHKEIRRQVVAPENHLIVVFDERQLEARVLGMSSRDKALCHSIISGHDIHGDWLRNVIYLYPDYMDRLADKTNSTDEKVILGRGRDIIKTDFVFSSFYGAIARTIAERTGIPENIVMELQEWLWQEFPEIKSWVRARRREYRETGSISTLTGLVRHQVMPGNEVINTPIQSTAAQLVNDAMNELAAAARREKNWYLHPRIQIHDDLTFIWPADDDLIVEYIEYVSRVLTRVRYDWQIVPLAVEVKAGENWSDLTKLSEYSGEYLR